MDSKELSAEEIKSIELNILTDVHNFCEQHGILYFLIGGTLLGAIRHQGFIPWDDDVDIAMPRPDYESFISNYSSRWYEVKSIERTNNYVFTFAKVEDTKTVLIENKTNKSNIGVNIDVFPVDGLPNDIEKAKKYADRSMRYKKLITIKQIKFRKGRSTAKNAVLAFGKIALLPFSYKRLTKMAIRYAKRYDFDNSDHVANLSWGFGKAEILSKAGVLKRRLVTFQNRQFYITENYEDYLINRFGDYRKLPPEDERKSHHLFKAFYKE